MREWQTKFHDAQRQLAESKALVHAQTNDSTELLQLREQLCIIRSQFDELEKSTETFKADLPTKPTINEIFKNFNEALRRSKSLIELIILTLEGLNSESVAQMTSKEAA